MTVDGTAGPSDHRSTLADPAEADPTATATATGASAVEADDLEADQVARMVAEVAHRGAAMQVQIVESVALAERRRREDGDAERALDGLLVDLDRIVGLV